MRDLYCNFTVIRNGADYGQIRPVLDSLPTLRMDDSGDIKISLSGDFYPTVYDFDGKPIPDAEVDWLTDQIRPELMIDGVEHHLGIYLPATVIVTEDTGGYGFRSLHVEAYDRCWQVQDSRLESLLHLSSNSNYITVIQQLLTAAGIGTVSATSSTAVLPEDREDWSIGTSRLEVVNQLLSEINYNPLWFDSEGWAILEPASVPSAVNIEHTLDAADDISLVLPQNQRQTDIYSAPNVWICVCSNPDKSGPMVATAENTNPQSPLSVDRRGRRICKLVTLSNIASQDELQAYADRLRNESMITGETIMIDTGLLPGHGVRDVVAVNYGDLLAVTIERAWTMDLGPGGTMSHKLDKVVINLG